MFRQCVAGWLGESGGTDLAWSAMKPAEHDSVPLNLIQRTGENKQSSAAAIRASLII